MIRLTRVVAKEIKPIMIDVDSIESIEPGDILTEITTKRGSVIKVKESPEEVARKVLEYRMRTEDYRHDSEAPRAKVELYRLAGLEEQKDE